MDMGKLTEKSRQAMLNAQQLAVEYGNQEIKGIHLLKSLCTQEDGLIPSLLKRMNVNRELMLHHIDQAIGKLSKVSGGGEPYTGREFSAILVGAKNKAEEMKDEYISTEHLFLVIADASPECGKSCNPWGSHRNPFCVH